MIIAAVFRHVRVVDLVYLSSLLLNSDISNLLQIHHQTDLLKLTSVFNSKFVIYVNNDVHLFHFSEPNNVISILISSDFLRMDSLVSQNSTTYHIKSYHASPYHVPPHT